MNKLLMVSLLLSSVSASSEVTELSKQTCEQMQSGNTLRPDNPIKCERLNSVKFDFINFAGETKKGQVVVLDVFAPEVEAIFKELYSKKFPLEKAAPLENYHGDDNASMADNNTSSFNGRPLTNATGWSKHAYGAAIDINPVQNPYLSFPEEGKILVDPPASYNKFTNRSNIRPGLDFRPGLAEEVRDIFHSHGFLSWGGDWDDRVDYQHFEVGIQRNYDYINSLLSKPLKQARIEFSQGGKSYRQCLKSSKQTGSEAKRKFCLEKLIK